MKINYEKEKNKNKQGFKKNATGTNRLNTIYLKINFFFCLFGHVSVFKGNIWFSGWWVCYWKQHSCLKQNVLMFECGSSCDVKLNVVFKFPPVSSLYVLLNIPRFPHVSYLSFNVGLLLCLMNWFLMTWYNITNYILCWGVFFFPDDIFY